MRNLAVGSFLCAPGRGGRPLQRIHGLAILKPTVYWHSCLLTYPMVKSPSWEANWFAASQEIPHILWNPKVHYRTHKRPPPVSIPGQPNPVHIPTSHLLEIHPNIINPSTPRSPQWSLSLRFPHQEPTHPLSSPIRDTCPDHWISSRGQLTSGGPPAWGLGEVLTTPPCKTFMLRTTHMSDCILLLIVILKSKNQLDVTYYFIVLLIGSTCFEHYYAHHHELATMMLITTMRFDQCDNQHHSRELLMMGIVMSETCSA